ncbi:hypothetical protein [Streptomyces sp. WAC06614]|uniref:hypothetical protein n=1 Tax=Streptomyces sp. WAC06614 TaxID=2487416 RepID=UPI000F7ACED3|nr:hypothetical protein [Streptomyces sp. WAC06614]RSS84284.1 hypothetical protein EF918_00755 [Streptomyces sp. WAC06614]
MSRHRATALALVLLAGAAGCAQGQDYAVPGDVCGVEVRPALLKPLLPPGGSFKQGDTSERGGDITGCGMEVDKRRELTFQASLVAANVDPLQVKSRNLLSAGNPQKADIGTDARIADSAAMAYSACTYKGEPHRYVVEVWVRKAPTDVNERREDLARFIAAYLPAAQKAAGCAR